MEVLNVTVLFGKVETILGLIAEGRAFSRTRDLICPGLHILQGDWWDLVGDVSRRSVNTVLVDDDRIEKVLEDMRWFYGASDWYAERRVPWPRGICFTALRARASRASFAG